MNQRDRWLFLTAVFIPLTTAVGAIFLLVWILKGVAPGVFEAHDSSGLELLVGMAVLLITLIAGFLAGALVFLLIWRPFVSRSVLESIFTQPKVPVFSQALAWFFNRIYPDKK